MTGEDRREAVSEINDEASLADGFDDAIIGTVYIPQTGATVALYDQEKMIRILMNRDGMTAEEASEFIDYNTLRGAEYEGENAPAFATLFEEE